MTVSTLHYRPLHLTDFYSASSLKQHSRQTCHTTWTNYTDSASVCFCSIHLYWVLSEEALNTIV